METPEPTAGPEPGTPPPPEPPRRTLTRSRSDRMIAGVCGGLAAYLDVDAVWVRLGAAVLALVTSGAAVLAYLVAAVIIPEGDGLPPAGAPAGDGGRRATVILGVVLVLVGVATLVDRFLPAFDRFFWPVALIAVGVALLWGRSDGPRP